LKNFLKTTAAISTTEVTLIFVGLVKNKYLAIEIGPEGFGIYGMLSSFFSLAAVFSGTWLATGATKYASEFSKKGDNQAVQKITILSIGLTTVLSLTMSLAFILGQEPIRKIFLSEEILRVYFTLFAVSFIGMSLRPVIIAILQGLKKVKFVVTARISISIVEIGLVVSLVYLFDLTGFFISLLLSSVIAMIILIKRLRGSMGKVAIPNLKFDDVSKKFFYFGGVNFFLAIANLGAQYFQRKLILDQMDLASIGLLQAAVSLRVYSDIIGRSSGFYFYPKMSEELKAESRAQMINDYMLFSLLTYIPIAMCIIFFSKYIVLLLYSADFIQLIPVLSWFIIAEYFHNIERPLGQTIVGLAALNVHAAVSLIASILWVVVPVYFMSSFGIMSIAIANSLGSFSSMLIFSIFLKRRIGLIIEQRNLIIALGGSIVLIIISLNTFTIIMKLVIILATLLVLFGMIAKEEKMKFKSYLKI
jgi:O-antigen/teichoic acid export membrane protein